MFRPVVVVLALLVSPLMARAEEAVGWSFSVPKGASLQKQDDAHVIYLNITGKTFCMYALYPPRATTASFYEDEWKGIVVPSFTAKTPSKLVTTKTKKGLKVTSRSAAVTDKQEGAAYATALYVIESGAVGGSVLLTSSNMSTLAKCPIQPLLASMSMLSPPPAAAASPPAPATTSPAPAAPATAGQPALAGLWGTGAGNPASRYGTGSTMRRQYSFSNDGTYTYRSEIYNGVNEWIIVRESGAYSVSGDQLTVEPKASTITSRDPKGTVKSTKKQALEKTTYRFRMHYFSGIQEWNLVLTPPQPTERDGGFSTVWEFKDSYLLKSTYAPEWKWP